MGRKLQLTEAQVRDLVTRGTKYVVEQIMNEARSDGYETVMVDMDQAIYEYERMNPEFDGEEDWLQDLPYEIPVEVSYSVDGGEPDTYDTPGTGITYQVLSINIKDFDASDLSEDQARLIRTIIQDSVEDNFQSFMEGNYRNLSKPKRRTVSWESGRHPEM